MWSLLLHSEATGNRKFHQEVVATIYLGLYCVDVKLLEEARGFSSRHQNEETKTYMTNQKNNKNQKKNKIDKIEVDVPRKLEKEVQQYNRNLLKSNGNSSSSVGINARTSKSLAEKIHTVQGGVGGNTLTVAGHCLLTVIETDAKYPTSSGSQNTYMLKRLFVHPGSVPSRRLSAFSNLFSKYKFKKFDLKYEGEVNTTVNGAFMVSYSKNFTPLEPFPGVSTRSWMSETQGVREMKVWDNGILGTLNKSGDLPSYFISKDVIEPDTTFQALVMIAGVGLVPNLYYGDLYLDYEIEFSMPLVPPTNFNSMLSYVAAGGTTLGNKFQWVIARPQHPGQVDYWGPRQGIYFCTLAASSWNGFSVCEEYSNRNFFGSSFIMVVAAGIETVPLAPNYDKLVFSIYDNIAAATLGEEAVLEVNDDFFVLNDLNFEGTLIASILPKAINTSDPVQVVAPSTPRIPSQNGNGMCSIGIGVGPGVFAGEPDIVPSIGFNGGRMVMGNPYRR